MGKTNAEVGKIFLDVATSAATGDFTNLSRYKFVGRIYRRENNRPAIPKRVREDVLSAGACAYCGSESLLEVDHIFPVSKGGTNDRGNLQPLCWLCNRKKGARV